MPKAKSYLQAENDKKLRELILYICTVCEGDKSFSATKLNKLLFFSDFETYRERGSSITQQEYTKQDFGPCPRQIVPLTQEMQSQQEVAIREEPAHHHTRKRLLALREANLTVFTAQEIARVDAIVRRYWNYTATQISDLSHEFIGWQVANNGETIPYPVAMLELRDLTEQEKQWSRELEPRALALLEQYG